MGRRMKTLLMLVIVTAMVSATGCASKSSEEVQPSHGVTSGPRFVIDLKPGPYYNGTATSFLVFRYTVQPQVAVWVEKPDGTYVDTLFVTSKAESGNRLLRLVALKRSQSGLIFRRNRSTL